MSQAQRKIYFALIVCTVAILATLGWQHFHTSHSADHHAHGDNAKLVLNDGKKWQTDAPLRQGMQQIRGLIAPLKMLSPGQSFNPDQAKSIALGVQQQVSYLINNCKLDEKADAVLHALIADLLKATELLSQQPPSAEGIILIQAVLDLYPQYFEHPGWTESE